MFLPERLISNKEKCSKIKLIKCDECTLLRRADKKTITPMGKISSTVWSTNDLFELSTNLFLCKNEEIDCVEGDVLLLPDPDLENPYFESDDQLTNVNIDESKAVKIDQSIVYISIKDVLSAKNTYPFKKGNPDEKLYNYRCIVDYSPMLYNAFHVNIKIETDQSGEWKPIDRKTKKGYLRSISTTIRGQWIMKELKVLNFQIP